MPQANQNNTMNSQTEPPLLHVAPSPHITTPSITTRQMMVDVLIALVPAALVALYLFSGVGDPRQIVLYQAITGAMPREKRKIRQAPVQTS